MNCHHKAEESECITAECRARGLAQKLETANAKIVELNGFLETAERHRQQEAEARIKKGKNFDEMLKIAKDAIQERDVALLQVDVMRKAFVSAITGQAGECRACGARMGVGIEHYPDSPCKILNNVTEKRHGLAECPHDHKREDVYWNEAGSTKSVKCVDCGSQLS